MRRLVRKKVEEITRMVLTTKGQLGFPIVLIMVFLVVVGIVWILSINVFDDLHSSITSDGDLSNESMVVLDDLHDRAPETFDSAFAVFFVLMWIVSLVMAYYSDSYPVLFFVTLFLVIVCIAVAALLANSFNDVMSDSDLAGASAQFPITNFIVDNLPIVILVIGLSYGLVLYGHSKRR